MSKTGTDNIPEPKITVRMPSTTLRLEHITYLRNLATNSNKIRCELQFSQIARLKLLGLLEEYEIPPDPEEVRKHKLKCEKTIETMKRLAAAEDWKGLGNLDTHEMRRNAPMPTRANRITKAGIELLKRNEVVVKLQKGCA